MIKKCTKCDNPVPESWTVFCNQCIEMRGDWQLKHNYFIRCPDCQSDFSVKEFSNTIWQVGEHTIVCLICDHQFQITTQVETHFISPALNDE